MATYKFTTPYVLEGPSGRHRLFYFAKLRKGITIIKTGGVYQQARYLVDDGTQVYQELYRGGHIHTGISEATKAALIAGNVGVTETNFTVE
jgi:hypothetical protein